MTDDLHPHDPSIPPGAMSLEQRLSSYEHLQRETLEAVNEIKETLARGSERHRHYDRALESKADVGEVRDLREDFEEHREKVLGSVTWAVRLIAGTVITGFIMGALGLTALGAVAYTNQDNQESRP